MDIFEKIGVIFIGGNLQWKSIDSLDSGLEMHMKMKDQKKGERSVAMVRAVGIADCRAEEGKKGKKPKHHREWWLPPPPSPLPLDITIL